MASCPKNVAFTAPLISSFKTIFPCTGSLFSAVFFIIFVIALPSLGSPFQPNFLPLWISCKMFFSSLKPYRQVTTVYHTDFSQCVGKPRLCQSDNVYCWDFVTDSRKDLVMAAASMVLSSDLNSSKHTNGKKFLMYRVCCWHCFIHVCSICCNDRHGCLLSHIDSCDTDIVALTETWQVPHIRNDKIFTSSLFIYEIFLCGTAQCIAGGVHLAVRPYLRPVVINLSVADLEMAWISVHCINNFTISVCYCPPDSPPSFVSLFYDAHRFPSWVVYIVGDFNFPGVVWGPLLSYMSTIWFVTILFESPLPN